MNRTPPASLIYACMKTISIRIHPYSRNQRHRFLDWVVFGEGLAQPDVMFFLPPFPLQFMCREPGSAGQERQVTGVHDETWVKIQTVCRINKCKQEFLNIGFTEQYSLKLTVPLLLTSLIALKSHNEYIYMIFAKPAMVSTLKHFCCYNGGSHNLYYRSYYVQGPRQQRSKVNCRWK